MATSCVKAPSPLAKMTISLKSKWQSRGEALVWGPIPLISPSTSTRTSSGAMKEKCLSALTDKAVAEAIAFLALAEH